MPLPMIFGAAIGAAADMAVTAQRRRRAGEIAGVAAHAAGWLQRFHALVEGTEAEGGPGPFVEALLASADAEATRLSGRSDPGAWRVAVDRWSRIDQPGRRAYATLRLAEALLDAGGDRDEARSLLQTAVGTATSIGAEPLVEEARSIGERARLDLDGIDAPAIAARRRTRSRRSPAGSATSSASSRPATRTARSATGCSSARRPSACTCRTRWRSWVPCRATRRRRSRSARACSDLPAA